MSLFGILSGTRTESRLVDWLELYRQINAVVANRRVFDGG
jgi:hypothetical protein